MRLRVVCIAVHIGFLRRISQTPGVAGSCYSFDTGCRIPIYLNAIRHFSCERGDHLRSNQFQLKTLAPCRFQAIRTGVVSLGVLSGLLAVGFLASQSALSQEANSQTNSNMPQATESDSVPILVAKAESTSSVPPDPPAEVNSPSQPDLVAVRLHEPFLQDQGEYESRQVPFFKRPLKSEIIIEGLYSYGNYKIFASGYDMKLFTGGVEYDRHSWGYLLKAQMDYVAEFLPFVLLDKPKNVDIYGNPYSCGSCKPPVTRAESAAIRQFVPGIGFSPIGFRLLWRPSKKIQPYLEAKGGVLVFAKKVPSTQAAYENFSLQSATGLEVKMNQRWGLRLGLFSDFHFSDAFVVPINPGLDVMNANLGLSYHFGTEK